MAMTKNKQIKVRIFSDGQVQAEVMGIAGKKCTDYISVLEELLDADTVDSEYTSEYYLQANAYTETTINPSVSNTIQSNKD